MTPENQSFAKLSRTVRTIAVLVGVAAGVGVPLSFGLMAYYAQISTLEYRTELAAERLGEYIYVQGKTWRFSEHRVADMISFTRIEGRQTVYDSANRRIASDDRPVAWPTLRIASPIVVLG